MKVQYTRQQLMGTLVSVHTRPLTHPHTSHTPPNTEVLEYLLSEGAPVNEAVVGVASPLHYAVAAGHITCIQILLQHNAIVNAMATNQQVRVCIPAMCY